MNTIVRTNTVLIQRKNIVKFLDTFWETETYLTELTNDKQIIDNAVTGLIQCPHLRPTCNFAAANQTTQLWDENSNDEIKLPVSLFPWKYCFRCSSKPNQLHEYLFLAAFA